jgi:hypothetical protein
LNPEKQGPLLLSVGQRSTSIKEVLSFSAATTPNISEVNPTAVYSGLTKLFGTAAAAPAMGVPVPVSEGDYRVAQGQSVLDLVRNDLKRLSGKNMSKADQVRVDAWATLLRSTETGMMEMMGGPMTPTQITSASCTADLATKLGVTAESVMAAGTGATGTRSGAFVFAQKTDDSMRKSFTLGGDMMLNLIALSALCDYNRVMGMIYPGYVIFDWDNIKHEYDHHGISHRSGDLGTDNKCVPNVMKMIQEIDNWYAGKYAKLVGILDSIPEGDKKLLDNTCTMYMNELSDGDAHNLNNLPIVIAGSIGGKLKQGQAVSVDSKNIGQGGSESGCTETMSTSGFTGSSGGNVPINKLYCTLMNAFGMTDNGQPWTKWGQFDNNSKSGEAFTNPGESTQLKAT